MQYQKLTRDEHYQSMGPKRILSLDGGGLRGIVSLGFLHQIEGLLRRRHGDSPDFRLSHYFDLIAGTSTGAILAAGLAAGMAVDELVDYYLRLGRTVFARSFWRRGMVRARYDDAALRRALEEAFGKTTTIGDASLETGLLIVTKRLDTGSPWPIGNNPRGMYFTAGPTDTWISNGDYLLSQIIRASTAAPMYFDSERVRIGASGGRDAVVGEFVDGGVSPHNNPSLQALLYATLEGFRVGWPTGANELLIVSIGTGAGDPGKEPAWAAAKGAAKAMLSLLDDCGALVETLMQWMSASPTARVIDGEIGDLRNDVLGQAPSFTYQRYQLQLTRAGLEPIKPGLSDDLIAGLAEMDDPANLALLRELGQLQALRSVSEDHFPVTFDLRVGT